MFSGNFILLNISSNHAQGTIIYQNVYLTEIIAPKINESLTVPICVN